MKKQQDGATKPHFSLQNRFTHSIHPAISPTVSRNFPRPPKDRRHHQMKSRSDQKRLVEQQVP